MAHHSREYLRVGGGAGGLMVPKLFINENKMGMRGKDTMIMITSRSDGWFYVAEWIWTIW